MSAYADALRLIARRELSVAECRARLLDRNHPAEDVEAALARLVRDGALDDRRAAHAHARTALEVKGRGRVRVARELQERGIERDVAARALTDVFGGVDERLLVARAVQKKLGGRRCPDQPAAYARLYQFLMRQGFSPAAIDAELRTLRSQDL